MSVLLRLEVKNFKSIREAEVRFGPLTCFVGHNGVGKSNLFDAISFLGFLAEVEIHEAAESIREISDGSASPLDLIYGRDAEARIELVADMVTPGLVVDDFKQEVEPSTSLLRYSIALGYDRLSDRLVVESEQLNHMKRGDLDDFLGFEASRTFKSSVAVGVRRGGPLISTDTAEGSIRLHGDGGSRGRPLPVGKSPLTVVGGTNTIDYPTVLAAKREMESWKFLHLEPSSMRSPDKRSAPRHVSNSGGNLASTLNALTTDDPNVPTELVNRLRALNSDVHDLRVDFDEARDQLALQARVAGVDNWLYGRSLSDGTLRYIALGIMLMDSQDSGMLCLEEPENGIHPSRIPDLVELLYDYATDPGEPVGGDNPMRQVVINTHSPEVVRQLHVNDMVFVERAVRPDEPSLSVFRPVSGTWRTQVKGFTGHPKDTRAVGDFIGGSPVRDGGLQLELEFGTAS